MVNRGDVNARLGERAVDGGEVRPAGNLEGDVIQPSPRRWRLWRVRADVLQRDLVVHLTAGQEGVRVADALREMKRQKLCIEGDGAVEVAHLEVGVPDVRRICLAHEQSPS